tara:strand:- start:569 stop:847 length:279 start_codon:yes stop_codon:yes gene_type:complete
MQPIQPSLPELQRRCTRLSQIQHISIIDILPFLPQPLHVFRLDAILTFNKVVSGAALIGKIFSIHLKHDQVSRRSLDFKNSTSLRLRSAHLV